LVGHNLIKEQYHCNEVRILSISKICPSLAIGFYIKDRKSFDSFEKEISDMGKLPDSFFSVFGKSRNKKTLTFQN
jgi:hypothetical protein